MSTPPESLAATRQWLQKAEHDLLAADRAANIMPALYDVAVYHAQQAMEKALKGFLAYHAHPFPHTHDLVVLLARCAGLDPSLAALHAGAARLTPYAVLYRYPGPAFAPSADEAAAAIAAANVALGQVRQRLPADATG